MPAAPQPNVIYFGWNINWKTSSPGNIAPFFAPLYWKCSDVCFPRIHAYWIPHVPKLKSWLQNPTGWYENLPPFTKSGEVEFLNMAIYPRELLSRSLSPRCFPGSNVLSWFRITLSTSEGRGPGCWRERVLDKHFLTFQILVLLIFPSGSWKLHSI